MADCLLRRKSCVDGSPMHRQQRQTVTGVASQMTRHNTPHPRVSPNGFVFYAKRNKQPRHSTDRDPFCQTTRCHEKIPPHMLCSTRSSAIARMDNKPRIRIAKVREQGGRYSSRKPLAGIYRTASGSIAAEHPKCSGTGDSSRSSWPTGGQKRPRA